MASKPWISRGVEKMAKIFFLGLGETYPKCVYSSQER
jgi:hypothetical protein